MNPGCNLRVVASQCNDLKGDATTLPMLNVALGDGIPAGRIGQFAGLPGSGKSLPTLYIAVSVLGQGDCGSWWI